VQLTPFEMEAGSREEIIVEWNWSKEDVANDWSITTYAPYG